MAPPKTQLTLSDTSLGCTGPPTRGRFLFHSVCYYSCPSVPLLPVSYWGFSSATLQSANRTTGFYTPNAEGQLRAPFCALLNRGCERRGFWWSWGTWDGFPTDTEGRQESFGGVKSCMWISDGMEVMMLRAKCGS